jgi:hypothetical protein
MWGRVRALAAAPPWPAVSQRRRRLIGRAAWPQVTLTEPLANPSAPPLAHEHIQEDRKVQEPPRHRAGDVSGRPGLRRRFEARGPAAAHAGQRTPGTDTTPSGAHHRGALAQPAGARTGQRRGSGGAPAPSALAHRGVGAPCSQHRVSSGQRPSPGRRVTCGKAGCQQARLAQHVLGPDPAGGAEGVRADSALAGDSTLKLSRFGTSRADPAAPFRRCDRDASRDA